VNGGTSSKLILLDDEKRTHTNRRDAPESWA
jgi:hypothetical protein